MDNGRQGARYRAQSLEKTSSTSTSTFKGKDIARSSVISPLNILQRHRPPPPPNPKPKRLQEAVFELPANEIHVENHPPELEGDTQLSTPPIDFYEQLQHTYIAYSQHPDHGESSPDDLLEPVDHSDKPIPAVS
jgi:hypothetical protein